MSPQNANYLVKIFKLMSSDYCVLCFDAIYHHRQSSCNMPSIIKFYDLMIPIQIYREINRKIIQIPDLNTIDTKRFLACFSSIKYLSIFDNF